MIKLSNPKISAYTEQFTALYNGHPWYGSSICELLRNVTPAIAYWEPFRDAHSIAQVISHMIYWRQALIKRLSGDPDYRPSMKSEDNWKLNEQLKKTGWKPLLRSLEDSQSQLISLLKQQKDSLLKKKYSDKATFQDLINGILQHDLYHTGQIAYLKSIYTNRKK